MDQGDLQTSEMLRISRELVPLLLQGDDPQLKVLSDQWRAATISISEPSTSGFYADISVPSGVPLVSAPDQGGGNAEIPVIGEQLPAGCVLYIVNGQLKFLEVYTAVDWQAPPSFGQPAQVEPLQLSQKAHGA